MDVRSKIVDNVLESLPDLPAEIKEQIERTLLVQLQDYEVQERCTAIEVHDNTNLGLVRKFIATKKLEGKSERTLRRYQPELERLVCFLNKQLFEVGPYDLRLYLSLYKERRRVSNRTLENMRKTISTFFGWLHDEGIIPQNPARAVKQIKYDKIVRKPFTPVERERLKNACLTSRFLGECGLIDILRTQIGTDGDLSLLSDNSALDRYYGSNYTGSINSLKTPGVYWCDFTEVTEAIWDNGYGWVEVIKAFKTGESCLQKIYRFTDLGMSVIAYRFFANDKWYPTRILNTSAIS